MHTNFRRVLAKDGSYSEAVLQNMGLELRNAQTINRLHIILSAQT